MSITECNVLRAFNGRGCPGASRSRAGTPGLSLGSGTLLSKNSLSEREGAGSRAGVECAPGGGRLEQRPVVRERLCGTFEYTEMCRGWEHRTLQTKAPDETGKAHRVRVI